MILSFVAVLFKYECKTQIAMSGVRLSRRDFLKFLGGAAAVGVLGKFVDFGTLNTQSQPPIPRVSALVLGSWTLGANTSIPPIHATLLRNGKIMYVAGSGWQHSSQFGPFKAAVFDPITNSETITVMSDDLFCCNFAQLQYGNILIAGGTKDWDNVTGDGKYHGGNYVYEFDVDSSSFRKVPSMAHGRWYPSMGILPSGKVFVMTGLDEYGKTNAIVEVYDPTFKTFTIKYDPSSSSTYCVGAGSTLPGAGTPCYGGPNKGVNPSTKLYDRMIVMPSGLVFKGGQGQSLNTWDPNSGKFVSAGKMLASARTYGTAVLLPLSNALSEHGRVLLAGGLNSSGIILNTAEIANFNAGTDTTPVISYTKSMSFARMYPLPVMLPTGQVILFGGTSGKNVNFVFKPEMFDPGTSTWTVLPAATVGRQYHSVALLLPDGRVWTASGTANTSSFEHRTEIYSPWYLFAGTRPTISGLPTVGPYGGAITIPTPNASSITSVSLLKLANTNHHQDWEHRLIWLQILTKTSSSVTVSAPINANLAPPGYYLIHALNSSGVPSPGKIIQIGSSNAGGTDTTPPTIGINSPSSRATILGPASGVIVNVAGTASDSQSGIQSVKVSIDGGPSSQATPAAAGDWSTWTFSTTINTMGQHTIEAIATDNAGNQAYVKIPVTIFL